MRLPDTKSFNIVGNMRQMQTKDASAVLKLYNASVAHCKIRQKMSQEELLHTLMPRDGLIWTWVVENEVEGKLQVTDFWSMKRVTNVVINKELKHEHVRQANMQFCGLSVNKYPDMVK